MTLEREIYSIETANINKETLDAMKNAGTAMKQIHAGLTIDKVDDVMYFYFNEHAYVYSTNSILGRASASSTTSATRSAKQSPRASQTTASTKTSWTRSSPNYSRRSSTRRCSRQATSRSTTRLRQGRCPRHQIGSCRNNGSKRTTRKRSCGSCRPRWPCELRVYLGRNRASEQGRGLLTDCCGWRTANF